MIPPNQFCLCVKEMGKLEFEAEHQITIWMQLKGIKCNLAEQIDSVLQRRLLYFQMKTEQHKTEQHDEISIQKWVETCWR